MDPKVILMRGKERFIAFRNYKINWHSVVNYSIRIAVIIAVLLIWLPLAMMVLYYLAETDVVITTVTFMAVLLVPAAITCWFRREALSLWKWWLVLALTPILVVPNFSLSIAFLLYLTLLLSAWRPVPKVGN